MSHKQIVRPGDLTRSQDPMPDQIRGLLHGSLAEADERPHRLHRFRAYFDLLTASRAEVTEQVRRNRLGVSPWLNDLAQQRRSR